MILNIYIYQLVIINQGLFVKAALHSFSLTEQKI